jgi:hypothetical protein
VGVAAALVVCGALVAGQTAAAQSANSTIQLPTFRVTQFRSSFSVPSGGSIRLGAIGNRFSTGGRRLIGRAQTAKPAAALIRKQPGQEERPGLGASPQSNRSKTVGLTRSQIEENSDIEAKANFLSRNINRSR